jgi:ribosomal protein S13
MARIAGIDLPRNKPIEIGLMHIYGIGRSFSNEILYKAGVDPATRVKDLTESEIAGLREVIAIGVCVTAATCLCMASVHGRTLAPSVVPRRPCLAVDGDVG